jgi:hypothetical protein
MAGVNGTHATTYQKLMKKVRGITPDYPFTGAGVEGDSVALFAGDGIQMASRVVSQEAEHGWVQGDGSVGGRVLLR